MILKYYICGIKPLNRKSYIPSFSLSCCPIPPSGQMSTTLERKVPVWFGAVHIECCGRVVRIVDALSGSEARLELAEPGQLCTDVGATEQYVFCCVARNDTRTVASVCAYDLRTERLFVSSPGGGWTGDAGCVHLSVRGSTDPTEEQLRTQSSHWEEYLDAPPDWTETSLDQRCMLACTAFGAFLIQNGSEQREQSTVLERLHDSRYDPPIGEENNSKNEVKSEYPKQYQLPFSVRKFGAGQDHLALLDSEERVWTLGTGTRGELGSGRVEAGNWAQGPVLIDALSDAQIRCVDVDCGCWHTVAITDSGDSYGWGWNGLGQLGHPSNEFSIQPSPFPFELADDEACAVRCSGNSTFVRVRNAQSGQLEERVFGEANESKKDSRP